MEYDKLSKVLKYDHETGDIYNITFKTPRKMRKDNIIQFRIDGNKVCLSYAKVAWTLYHKVTPTTLIHLKTPDDYRIDNMYMSNTKINEPIMTVCYNKKDDKTVVYWSENEQRKQKTFHDEVVLTNFMNKFKNYRIKFKNN